MCTWPLVSISILLTVVPRTGFGQAILWQAPEGITVKDWIWGVGGEARAPRPPFEFVDEDFNGTNPKIRVRDAKGNRWIVKFGGENHGDVFAARLLHALGYLTEPSYYVASGTITGVHGLKRARAFVSRDGSFRFARFKLHDHKTLAAVKGQPWSWNDNPFLGTPQLNGLKILMMLTSNWDAKDARDGRGANTSTYANPSTGERFYSFDDWGATMGKSGGFFSRDKWDPAGYAAESDDFARLTAAATIQWGYRGKHNPDIVSNISVADVRWLLTYLSRVTDEQLRAGLRASGATDTDIATYTRAIQERIAQLRRLTESEPRTTATAEQRHD
ncbi:MAG TPA: hypothetical protein VFA33_13550 [Bryobacteraceae bacterium]|nr:hypothetical protein [Bryobacteraceae bacterium]